MTKGINHIYFSDSLEPGTDSLVDIEGLEDSSVSPCKRLEYDGIQPAAGSKSSTFAQFFSFLLVMRKDGILRRLKFILL